MSSATLRLSIVDIVTILIISSSSVFFPGFFNSYCLGVMWAVRKSQVFLARLKPPCETLEAWGERIIRDDWYYQSPCIYQTVHILFWGKLLFWTDNPMPWIFENGNNGKLSHDNRELSRSHLEYYALVVLCGVYLFIWKPNFQVWQWRSNTNKNTSQPVQVKFDGSQSCDILHCFRGLNSL